MRARLGSGAFGTVYRAYDPQLDREVALKVPRPGVLDSPKRVERFLREARAAAQLRHPHIVPIYDAGQDGERHYIAAAFINGRPLSDAVAEGGLEFLRAATIVRHLAQAAGYAHALGIVHRDIKPANVMLDEKDQPLLMDFGLAARADEEGSKLTQDGAVLGTPAYMAPEQAAGQQGDAQPASDQYSLGVLLYELLTGKTPFEGPAQIVLYNAINTAPPPPQTLRPDVPGDLEAVCLKAMAKKADDRYPDCQEFAADLGRWLDGEFVQARRPAATERFAKWRRRNPRLAAAVLSAAAVLLASSGGAVVYAGKARYDADSAAERAEESGREAEQSRALAEESRAEAEQRVESERSARAEERLRGEQVRYAQQIQKAHQAWRDGQLDRARFHLDAARWDLRGWEHAYLERLVAGSRLTLRGHTAPITCLTYSPDGRRIASGSADETVRLWDGSTGELLRTIRGFSGEVRSVAFSPDGKRLATVAARSHAEPPEPGRASPRSEVKLWDADSGKELLVVKNHPSDVWSVAFNGDGDRLAAACGQRTGMIGQPMPGGGAPIVVPPGGAPGPIVTPPAVGPAPVVTPPAGAPAPVVPAPDKPAVSPAKPAPAPDGGAEEEQQDGPKPIRSEPRPASHPEPAAEPGVVKVWEVTSGKEVQSLKGPGGAFLTVAYSPDGKHLVAGDENAQVKVWDAVKGDERPAVTSGLLGPLTALQFGRDGRQVYAATAMGKLSVFDLRGVMPPQLSTEDSDPIVGLTVVGASPWNSQVFTVGSGDPKTAGEITVRNAMGFSEIARLKGHRGMLLAIAARPDGGAFATGGDDRTIKVWETKRSPQSLVLPNHFGPVHAVAFRPDGKQVASAAEDGRVLIRDAKTGDDMLELAAPGPVRGLAFSPDGKRLVTVGASTGGMRPMVMPVPAAPGAPPPPAPEKPKKPTVVVLWDAVTGKELRTLAGHDGQGTAVAFSPDGKQIATAADAPVQPEAAPRDEVRLTERVGGGEIKLWDAESGNELHALKGHSGSITSLAYSPDSARIVSGSLDRTARVWNAQSGEEALTLTGHSGEVFSVAYAPDGKQIAGAVGDSCTPERPGEVVLWDAVGGKAVRALRGHRRAVTSVAYSADGQRLVSGGGCAGPGGAGCWGVPGVPGAPVGAPQYSAAPAGVTGGSWMSLAAGLPALALSWGNRPVMGHGYGHGHGGGHGAIDEIKVWGPHSGLELLHLEGHSTPVIKKVTETQMRTVTVMRERTREEVVDGKKVMRTEPYPEQVAVPETRNKKVMMHVGACVTALAFSPDGERIASGDSNGGVRLWDAHLCQPHANLSAYAGVLRTLAWSADGRWLASAGESGDTCNPCQPGEVKVWDATTGEEHVALRGHSGFILDVAFSRDGRRLAVASGCLDAQKRLLPGEVKVWDIVTKKELFTVKDFTGSVTAVAFSNDGSRLAAGESEGTVRLCDGTSGATVQSLKAHAMAVNDLAYSPDGKWLATAGGDRANRDRPGEVKLWNTESYEEARTLKGAPGPIWSVAFRPDSAQLAAGGPASGSGIVLLWETATGTESLRIEAHAAEVNGVAFSPDGKSLATASGDWGVKLWDLESRQEVLTLKGHGGPTTALAFGPDDSRLASAGADSLVKVWGLAKARAAVPHCGKGLGCLVVSPGEMPPALHPTALDKDGRLPLRVITTVTEPEQREAMRKVMKDGKQVDEKFTFTVPVYKTVEKLVPRDLATVRAYTAGGKRLDAAALRQRLATPTNALYFTGGRLDHAALTAYREDTLVIVTDGEMPAPANGKPGPERPNELGLPAISALCRADGDTVEVGVTTIMSVMDTEYQEVAETITEGGQPRMVKKRVPVTVCKAVPQVTVRRVPIGQVELYDLQGRKLDATALPGVGGDTVSVVTLHGPPQPINPAVAAILKPGTLQIKLPPIHSGGGVIGVPVRMPEPAPAAPAPPGPGA